MDFTRPSADYTKLKTQRDAANILVSEANDALANPDNGEMQFLLVDNILHGALGRVNEIEIQKIQSRGGWTLAPARWLSEAKNGTMPPQLVKQLQEFALSQKRAIEKAMAARTGATPQAGARQTGGPQTGGLPPAARAQLKAGHITTFGNGQKWTLENSQPKQVQ